MTERGTQRFWQGFIYFAVGAAMAMFLVVLVALTIWVWRAIV